MKKLALISLVIGVMAYGADSAEAIRIYRERQEKATPQSVLQWLQSGNRRFAAGVSDHGGYVSDARERIAAAGAGQRPLAAVLSCIDSRTTPEMVFDTSVGDLFTARVGANVIGDDILGSLEVAVASGIKVVTIMGHTDCGGVRAACNGLELGHLTQLLERIKPAILRTNLHLDAHPELSKEVGERIGSNRRYIREVSHMNAKQSKEQALARSSFLREAVEKGEILFYSALYDVDSGRVTFD